MLAELLPLPKVRQLGEAAEAGTAPRAVDAEAWRRCAELGWFGLGVPSGLGGVGCGPVEEVMLFTELGRHLAPGPYASTAMAAWTAAAAGADELAADLIGGRRRAGLCVDDFVLDGEPGGLVVSFDGTTCVLAEIATFDVVPSVDPSVRLARVTTGGAVAEIDDPLVFPRAQLLVSSMELGIASAVLEMSVEYVKTRQQFGKPIGTFQAVKHRCAEMATRVHAARAQSLFAAYHLESRSEDSAFQAASAKTIASRAAKLNAADNVQNHGAIGFTVEHDAGLFARRAHMLEFALGGERGAAATILAPSSHRFETLGPPVEPWFASAGGE
jgi:alkylation response protein AidB-like acyl-CoA dehydrogenase